MPYTRLQEKARAKYITPKEFQEQYSLSKAQAYKLLAMPEMQEAIIKTGEKSKKVNLDRAFEIMQQLFNWKEVIQMKLSDKQKYELLKSAIGIIALLWIFIPIIVEAICK